MLNQLHLKVPIIQAPMAGDATTPELVAAVSNAGALGSIGAGYMSPEKMRQTIRATRALTHKPFSVNLFIPHHPSITKNKMDLAVAGLNQVAQSLNVTSEPVCAPFSESFEAQMRVVLEEKVPVFSFTFGLLDSKWIQPLKSNHIYVIGTATSIAEAHALISIGVDAIVLQGSEAGGHRGTFLGAAEASLNPLSNLLAQSQSVIKKVPLIAAGGIANGQAIKIALQSGAALVQMGTAFLTTDESGIHPAYKAALLALQSDHTTLTRTFSGKLARGIENAFIHQMERHHISLLDYPAQHVLTQKIRNTAKLKGNIEYMSMWAGQSAWLNRDGDVKTLITQLIHEMRADF